MKLLFVIVALIQIRLATASQLAANASEPVIEDEDAGCGLHLFRLPSRVVPVHYNLIMMPDLESLSFAGAVQISLEVQQEMILNSIDGTFLGANQIVLHASDSLQIHDISYLELDERNNQSNSSKLANGTLGSNVPIRNVCRDGDYQLIVISFARKLKSNSRGLLHLNFAGLLDDSMRGFYRSAYKSSTGNATHYYATTQFQATEARHAFPCFDEPALKATFDLTLIFDSNLEALANTEPVFEGRANKLKLVQFARTPLMSTYLLAFVVGEFGFVERSLFEGVADRELRMRIYTQPGQHEQGRYALEIASKALEPLEKLFGSKYPLTKLDIVAIPEFEAGAMENWGLIMFKATQLLVDANNSSPSTRSLVASTIIHELAHQWFGNLVTMEWWNDLWLNEGFATWMEYALLEQLYPNDGYYYHYLLDSHIHALTEDSFRSAHAVRPQYELEEPTDIDDLFDAISYNKAASIIRQLERDYLNQTIFNKALKLYLHEHQYRSSNFDDLLRALESVSGLKVRPFLESWLNQPGHPVVIARLSDDKRSLYLRQERFVSNHLDSLSEEEAKQRWIIPVKMLISSNQHNKQLTSSIELSPQVDEARIELPSWFDAGKQTNWLKLNANFSGFYRVLYSRELMQLFKSNLKFISPADQLNLVDEAHALTMAGRLTAGELAELLSWFEQLDGRQNGAVLESLINAFNALHQLYERYDDDELTRRLRAFARRLFSPALERLEARESVEQLGVAAAFYTLVLLDYEPAIERAIKLFSSPTRVDLHLRRSVYTAIARRGSHAHFEQLFKLFAEADGSLEQQQRIANALARARDPQRLEAVWAWLAGEVGRKLDEPIEPLHNMISSAEGRKFLIKLFETQLNKLIVLNKHRPINALIEEVGLSLAFNQVSSIEKLFLKHRNATDWMSSRDYINKTLDWHLKLAQFGAQSLRATLAEFG